LSPLVSILIPAFNAERWIASAIRSATEQTWNPKEIIVVDDGSRDKTLQVARSFESVGVKIIAQQSSGASAARNNALAHSNGQYIQWLDADDLIAPDKIARQMNAATQFGDESVLFSSSWGHFDCSVQETRFVPSPLWQSFGPTEWLITKMERNAWMAINCWLVSRHLTEKAGPWNENLRRDNDGDYFSRVVAGASRVHFVEDAKCYVRRHFSGISSELTLSPAKIESIFIAITNQINYLLELENTPEARHACVTYLQAWLPHFYPERMDLVQNCQMLANKLGGTLCPPELPWKYSWIQALFGWSAAKFARAHARRCKTIPRRTWNRLRSALFNPPALRY
jgi:glycosyltransferase involved in cell wall biosynthesis